MDLLLLGGTAFLGRAIAAQARDRGMAVTCLARGSAPTVPGVSFVQADRDAPAGLAQVSDRTWDAVVDVTRQPGQARRAVADISARHWVLISTGNVYAAFDRLEQDESSPTLEPLTSDVMADMSEYGPAKVACEEAVRAGQPSHTIIRSGLIGGFGDASGRTGYYPWRFAHPTGPDVLVPDDPSFPTAMIDVEDLASWTLDCAERRVQGTFNATGPTMPLSEVLDLARQTADSPLAPRYVPVETLAEAGVEAWMGPSSLPLWIDDPTWRFFATMDTTAARAHGLTTRPVDRTLAEALRYEEGRTQESRTQEGRTQERQTGLTDEEERRLRSALTSPSRGLG